MPIDARLAALRRSVAAPLPHPGVDELRASAGAIQEWALQHYESLPDQSIGLTASPQVMGKALHRPPPKEGRPFADVLADFRQHIEPFAFRVNHPKFMAFIPGAPCFPAILGDWLAAAANFFAGVWLEAAGPSQVETTVLAWFREWLDMPASTRGMLTSGGSEANLTALVVARERVPFADRSRIVLYVAEQRHWSVDRGAKVIGLHPEQVRAAPVDGEFRLRGSLLAELVDRDRVNGLVPWAVVANGGATNTGTVDNLAEIAAVCQKEELWLHIDAAYGWVGLLVEQGREELAGIELADSITLDPHKWLAQTFDVGCLLVRDGQRLPEAFAMRPDYLQDVVPGEDEVNYADCGIALTRRFRALKIWLSLQMLGLDWFKQLAQHGIALAEYAQARLESTGVFDILSPRRLSIVCFRYDPPDCRCDLDVLNSRLANALRETGKAFLSSTRLRGAFALRMCFINWRTSADDVDAVIDILIRLGTDLANRPVESNVPTVPAKDAR
ncbi:MAG TPA: pyridoxal-dependent decarboxylase [Gemmataceae bacterium]|jgi:glutamate/tyrosine decarboxylase-like PLP-dependent enzyme|nr:pyridoxal-dependent decarboxylase [Gemmataceae bacterium]